MRKETRKRRKKKEKRKGIDKKRRDRNGRQYKKMLSNDTRSTQKGKRKGK